MNPGNERPLTAEALNNILDNANNRLQSHQEWLAAHLKVPQLEPSFSSNLITKAPSIFPRQTEIPACRDISITAFSAGANSASSVFSLSLASVSSTASASIISLGDALASVEASASVALSSATSSLFAAQSSMTSVISMVERNASMTIASAAELVASANAAADRAKANATAAIRDAEARIYSANQAAQASILASQTAAMNTTKFALSVTFSILGSSIITIILFYLTIRWRKRRREQRVTELKQKIHLRNTTPSPDLGTPRPPVAKPLGEIRVEEPIKQEPIQQEPAPPVLIQQKLPKNTGLVPVNRRLSLQSSINGNDTDSEIFGMPNRPKQNSNEEEREKFPGLQTAKENIRPGNSEEKKEVKDVSKVSSLSSDNSPTPSNKPAIQYDSDRPIDPPRWFDNNSDESAVLPPPPLLLIPPKSRNRPTSTRDALIGAAI